MKKSITYSLTVAFAAAAASAVAVVSTKSAPEPIDKFTAAFKPIMYRAPLADSASLYPALLAKAFELAGNQTVADDNYFPQLAKMRAITYDAIEQRLEKLTALQNPALSQACQGVRFAIEYKISGGTKVRLDEQFSSLGYLVKEKGSVKGLLKDEDAPINEAIWHLPHGFGTKQGKKASHVLVNYLFKRDTQDSTVFTSVKEGEAAINACWSKAAEAVRFSDSEREVPLPQKVPEVVPAFTLEISLNSPFEPDRNGRHFRILNEARDPPQFRGPAFGRAATAIPFYP